MYGKYVDGQNGVYVDLEKNLKQIMRRESVRETPRNGWDFPINIYVLTRTSMRYARKLNVKIFN